ncbi:hypothetical protein FQR65_LT19729 [Abscondita terminalis]|nr:hypothetical protein FQR65_LT19729 [Abscondita terminalis]
MRRGSPVRRRRNPANVKEVATASSTERDADSRAPFLEPRNDGEEINNRSHRTSRVKIENLFGIWKRRFPIMAYGCGLNLDKVFAVIISTAVLHNIARINEEPMPPDEVEVMQYHLQKALRDEDIPAPLNYNNNNFDHRRFSVLNHFTVKFCK